MKRTVLSERLVRSRAALAEKTLTQVNDEAGFPPKSGYIYRRLGKDNVYLSTINRIARVLGCGACDIMEEIEDVDFA